MQRSSTFDAFLLLSFGGPEGMADVIPFVENVLRGRNVPRERMLEVAEHYYHFDGISPINSQCRALIASLEQEFRVINAIDEQKVADLEPKMLLDQELGITDDVDKEDVPNLEMEISSDSGGTICC